jgi:hypothetical protein
MPELATPFVLLPGVLAPADLEVIKQSCKRTLLEEDVPCFAMIDQLESPVFRKIQVAVEAVLQEPLHYLNDFYIYTDETFRTNWHMDTELFTFEAAVNAWILLAPDEVEDPLGLIPDLNAQAETEYHSVTIKEGDCSFRNYRTGKATSRRLADVEAAQSHTPKIRTGDILILNPRMFHKTNVTAPKHAFAIKFVFGSRPGHLAPKQVPSMFWPEVKTFNDIVKRAADWNGVVGGIRSALKSPDGKEKLSSGFYPEKFELYKRRVRDL